MAKRTRRRPVARQKVLGHHGAQHQGQLPPNAFLFVGGEHGHPSLHRSTAVARMHRCEHQVARLRRHHRHPHRLQFANLPHQDDIRILPQRRHQGLVERSAVLAHLPLVHQTLAGRMHVFHRVLDRHHMRCLRAIDPVNQRSQRHALTRARRPRHHHQPVAQLAQPIQRFR